MPEEFELGRMSSCPFPQSEAADPAVRGDTDEKPGVEWLRDTGVSAPTRGVLALGFLFSVIDFVEVMTLFAGVLASF